MKPHEIRAAWERAAKAAARAAAKAAAQSQSEIATAAILPGDVPTFIEAPAAMSAAELVGADVAVLGIPFEGAESSAAESSAGDSGPAAIRQRSVFYSLRQGRGFIPEADRGLVLLDHLRIVDYGDVVVVPSSAEKSFLRAHEKLADIFAAGAVPIVLGGDHSIPIPVLQVLAGKLTGKLGIVTLDSSFDLGLEPKYRAGSQWARAFELGFLEPENFVQIGIRGAHEALADREVAAELGHRYYTMADVDELGITTVAQEALEAATAGTEALYISLDVGVIDSVYGGQKHPDPAGLSARELLRALRVLARGPLAGFDVCGLAPRYDAQGHLSQLAARAAVEVIAGLALQRP